MTDTGFFWANANADVWEEKNIDLSANILCTENSIQNIENKHERIFCVL